jgi:hypothetical protein
MNANFCQDLIKLPGFVNIAIFSGWLFHSWQEAGSTSKLNRNGCKESATGATILSERLTDE